MEPDYPLDYWHPLLFDGTEEAQLRRNIIIGVFSHPTEIITHEELLYQEAVEKYSESEVEEQLDTLLEVGILTELESEENEYVFYSFTDEGKQYVVDSKLYRTNAPMKALLEKLERTNSVQEAYEAMRPNHPPATREYEERSDVFDSKEWDRAERKTTRRLKLRIEPIYDDDNANYRAELIDMETSSILCSNVALISNPRDDEVQEYQFPEPRGKIVEDSKYDVEFSASTPHSVDVNVLRGDEEIYNAHVFKEMDKGI